MTGAQAPSSCGSGPCEPAMDAELLVVADCPHEESAVELFRRVLDDTGHSSQVHVSVIRTVDEAALRGFHGSPSFFVGGGDLFPVTGRDAAIACRIYPSRKGLFPIPAYDALRNALERSAGAGGGTEPRC